MTGFVSCSFILLRTAVSDGSLCGRLLTSLGWYMHGTCADRPTGCARTQGRASARSLLSRLQARCRRHRCPSRFVWRFSHGYSSTSSRCHCRCRRCRRCRRRLRHHRRRGRSRRRRSQCGRHGRAKCAQGSCHNRRLGSFDCNQLGLLGPRSQLSRGLRGSYRSHPCRGLAGPGYRIGPSGRSWTLVRGHAK